MGDLDNSLDEQAKLLEQRLSVVGMLANSLQESRMAFRQNDAEAIARGAAHQAELCRQWSCLENQLRAEASRRQISSYSAVASDSREAAQSARLQTEWTTLATRIRYLSRVHWSLLRHMQRTLDILQRVVDGCAPTYTPSPEVLQHRGVRARAGE